MTFSNVGIFNNMVSILNPAPDQKVADRIVSGGAFAPNTLESVAIMRSNLDNDWETAFIIKYNALMQNRLNRIRQDLQNAYKALIEISTVQQVRENGITADNTALTDVKGNILPGAADAFKDLTYYDNEAAFNAADAAAGTYADGVPSYWQNDPLGVYEMRKLYIAGPALQVVNDMKVQMRSEEVPPKKPNMNVTIFPGAPDPFNIDINFDFIGDLVGSPPYVAGQKVAEYSTEVKTGGFWSTVNYLYNFAPREMKYNYVTAYSTTTEEAGTRQLPGGKQATLYSTDLLDGRDAGLANMNDDVPTYNALGNKPPVGERIKWNSSNPNDGYLTEMSPVFTPLQGSIDNRVIHRRDADNDGVTPNLFDPAGNFNTFNDTVRSDWSGFDDVTGMHPDGVDRAQTSYKRTVYGVEESVIKPLSERIKWEYEHDGVGAADLTRDGRINDSDIHVAKAAFLNHYIIQTKEVELNSSSSSFGRVATTGGNLLRSPGVDGSAEHAANNETSDDFPYPTSSNSITQSIVQDDDDNDNDYSNDTGDRNEKLLLAGSGKISKNFDGTFIKNNHSISSFNGQEISTNGADVRISTNNDSSPIVVAEYEGMARAKAMSIGMAEDYVLKGLSGNLSATDTDEFIEKFVLEANASGMVDTDWHYSQVTSGTSGIMFRNFNVIKDSNGTDHILYNKYDPSIRSNPPDASSSWANVDVAFRRTFNLQGIEFRTGTYNANFANGDVYLNTAEPLNENVFVNVTTVGMTGGVDLMVNGKIVPIVAGVANIGPYLKEGDNVIAAQTTADGSNIHAFTLTAAAGNTAAINKMINGKITTDVVQNGDTALSDLKGSSSWQSKLMVSKASNQAEYDMLSTERTVTDVKEQNAFARMLTDIINRPEYQDIFNLGLLNTNIGKTLSLKADVSAPTGGTVSATIDIQYDPVNRKFTLVQNKWDAFGGL